MVQVDGIDCLQAIQNNDLMISSFAIVVTVVVNLPLSVVGE